PRRAHPSCPTRRSSDLNLALVAGATVIIVPRFGLDVFLRAVQDYGITRAEVVPPMVLGLATAAAVDDYDLSSLRLLTSAAAPLGDRKSTRLNSSHLVIS